MVDKYYAVVSGHHPGVYTDWNLAEKMITGYLGAIFKSFSSKAEAEAFLEKSTKKSHSQIYVYGNSTNGYGILVKKIPDNIILQVYGQVPPSYRKMTTLYAIYIAVSLVSGDLKIYSNHETIEDPELLRAIHSKMVGRRVIITPLVKEVEEIEAVIKLANEGSLTTESLIVFKNGIKQI